jgi:PAS domain S-box-containing protein
LIEPKLPENETERLIALKSYQILNTDAEPSFDDFTQLAAYICDTPIALISLTDKTQQWLKSKIGIVIESIPREISFCSHAIHQSSIFEIENALEDSRFFDNPLVTSAPNIRFYAGALLIDQEGYKIGTLCVMDTKPRTLTDKQRDALERLSRQIMLKIRSRAETITVSELNHQLSEQALLIKNIPDSIPVLISYWDQDLRCRFANEAYSQLYGYPANLMIGKTMKEIARPEIYEHTASYARKALSGKSQIFEISGKSYDGALKHGTVYYMPDIRNGSEVLGFFSFITDITNLKLLQEKQQLAATVLEHVSDGIIITDNQHRVVSINRGFTRLTGYHLEDVIDKVPSFLDSVMPEEQVIALIIETLATQHLWSGEVHLRKKNGEYFYCLLTVDCIYDDQRKVVNHVALFKDRTEEIASKLELESLTNMLERTGDIARIGGWEIDIHTHQFKCSSSLYKVIEATPYSKISLDQLRQIVSSEVRNRIIEATESCLKEGTPWKMEAPFITLKNKEIWVQISGERVCKENIPIKLIGSIQDITERKLMEIQRLKDELLQKNTLVQEVHHRIKNNLMGVSNLLLNCTINNPVLTAPLHDAISKVQSVAMVHGLQGKNLGAKVELAELITSIAESIKSLWEANISIEIPDSWTPLYIIELESVPIALIFNELISNAVKHSKDTKKITIKIESFANSQNVMVIISNTGNLNLESNTDQPQPSGTGLNLVKSLMPKNGISLSLQQNFDMVDARVTIKSPIIGLESKER